VGTRGIGVPTPLFGVGTPYPTFVYWITLKYVCDPADVLATRRIALLVKSLQWKQKDPVRKSL